MEMDGLMQIGWFDHHQQSSRIIYPPEFYDQASTNVRQGLTIFNIAPNQSLDGAGSFQVSTGFSQVASGLFQHCSGFFQHSSGFLQHRSGRLQHSPGFLHVGIGFLQPAHD